MITNPKAVLAAAIVLLAGMLPAAGLAMDQYDAPETVTIGTLANLYKPVLFSHIQHAKMAKCRDCHHHTTGQSTQEANCVRCHAHSPETPFVACKHCHSATPFSPSELAAIEKPGVYHIDKPGLKAAYHLNCVPCHIKENAPSGCQGCHAMTEEGKKLFKVDLAGKAGATQQHKK